MRAPRVPVEEQYRLIMECRKSGLSDYQWCLNNDINPGTFYNWVKRLRKNGCGDIPEKNQLSTYEQSHQEVVKIEMNSISVPTDMNKNTDNLKGLCCITRPAECSDIKSLVEKQKAVTFP